MSTPATRPRILKTRRRDRGGTGRAGPGHPCLPSPRNRWGLRRMPTYLHVETGGPEPQVARSRNDVARMAARGMTLTGHGDPARGWFQVLVAQPSVSRMVDPACTPLSLSQNGDVERRISELGQPWIGGIWKVSLVQGLAQISPMRLACCFSSDAGRCRADGKSRFTGRL